MTFLQRVSVTLQFGLALVSGSASFKVTYGGKQHTVTLTNNGKPSGPNPALLSDVIQAVLNADLPGIYATTVTLGSNTWIITVQ